jgi:hypothetical protein
MVLIGIGPFSMQILDYCAYPAIPQTGDTEAKEKKLIAPKDEYHFRHHQFINM